MSETLNLPGLLPRRRAIGQNLSSVFPTKEGASLVHLRSEAPDLPTQTAARTRRLGAPCTGLAPSFVGKTDERDWRRKGRQTRTAGSSSSCSIAGSSTTKLDPVPTRE